jgi:hypothetical protein
MRTNQGGGCIADANHLRSSFDLRCRKAHRSIDDKIEQVADEYRIVGEIHHQPIDTSQFSGLCARALDPPFDQQVASSSSSQQLDSTDAIFASPSRIAGGWSSYY